MNMMQRLLHSVNNVWNTQAKEKSVFTVRKGNGPHTFMTLDAGQLHFHSTVYHHTIPIKQSIVLDGLTLNELITLMGGMGYTIDVLPGTQRYLAEGATLLMSFRDTYISEGYTCAVYTSNVWKMLYPLARLLDDVKGDVDLAIQQMFLRNSKAQWLDYWASFFAVKRYIGETDNELIKRIVLFLVNPKTNNRSIEELMKIVLGLNVEITDGRPSPTFNVYLEAEGMSLREESDKLLNQIKAGGVFYVYNYYRIFMEDYDSYLRDSTGKSLREIDNGASTGESDMRYVENKRNVLDALGWEIEYPTEVIHKVLDLSGADVELPYAEQRYVDLNRLADSSDAIEVEQAEARYLLKLINGQRDPYEGTSEVYLQEDTLRAKIQGELEEIALYFTGHEQAPLRTEQGESVLYFEETDYRYVQGGPGFTLNVSVANGNDLLMPLTRLTESFRMFMTDSSGQVVQSIN